VIALLTTPRYIIVGGQRLHNYVYSSGDLNGKSVFERYEIAQRQIDVPNAVIRGAMVVGSTLFVFFALSKIQVKK
jgi:hypothetical protein